jgi:predicted DNA-binding protein (MmcQ/YjbR family)
MIRRNSGQRGELELALRHQIVIRWRFLELTDRPGIIPAPCLARAIWVYVQADAEPGDEEAAALLRRSWELVFARLTKRLQREILVAPAAS